MARTLPAGNALARPLLRLRRSPLSPSLGLGYLAMVLAIVVTCLPLVWMAFASLRSRQEIYTLPISWIPETLRWPNYERAWNAVPFGRYFVNSLVVTGCGASLKLINATLTAYALVFLPFPRKNLVFLAVIAALMVPAQVTLIPNYVLVSDLGWVNTYQGIIIPTGGVAIGTFLLRQHFLTIPKEIIEAASIDGAGHFRMLWQIVIPMSRPTLVAVGLVAVVTEWNDYLWPLLVANTTDFRTLPVGLTALQNSEGATEWGVVMAGTVMVIAPVLLLFLWAQRHIIEGLTAGSVKG
jgi:sn-glycerol 3-phosphate transport system permease protein